MASSRRQFLAGSASLLVGARINWAQSPAAEPIIDIHQHTPYHGRTDEELLAHQRTMGVTTTILLPSGSPVPMPSTHMGKSFGLAAKTGGNEVCMAMAKRHPGEYVFGANEITDLPTARQEIEKYLKLGAVIIGEQKFMVEADSKESEALYELAAEYKVPILIHIQQNTYNLGYERFDKVLEKHRNTIFIGHAQTMWAHIDKNYDFKKQGIYPKGPVTAGGLTDRYLAEHPNFYSDLSAGSGLNAIMRDEDHARGFFDRHQDKLLYGSDCADKEGQGPKCSGAGMIAAIRKLAPNKTAERKMLYENSKKLFRLG